jgi:hypothetical protein
MGLVFTIEVWDEEFQIEITPEGDLEFVDYDIQYDLAAFEFGYPETKAMKLLTLWKKEPTLTIARKFPMTEEQKRNIRADWSNHVINQCQKSGHPWLGSDLSVIKRFLGGASTLDAVAHRAAYESAIGIWVDDEDDEENVTKWKVAYDAEVAWQVRRFIDVMTASKRGEKNPPLEATP